MKERMTPKQVHIIGGRTAESLSQDDTAARLAHFVDTDAREQIDTMDINLHLTGYDGGTEGLDTEHDVKEYVRSLVADYSTKLIFWLIDSPQSAELSAQFRRDGAEGRDPRKDIYLASSSFSSGLSGSDQYETALAQVKRTSANLSLAYDTASHSGMIVAPEEAAYDETSQLESLATSLVDISELRSHLTFTRSTVIDGEPVDWNSSLVYPSLREVVNYCVDNDAYKPFRGMTAGHFAVKIGEHEFLTSRRKTDFRRLGEIGLVRVVTDGPDNVIAYGSKPSVGGQSQRIVFDEHAGENCIVHFHCPIKPGSNVPTVSQREYECGSHECGMNTSAGLEVVDDGIKAVYLDNHGPNVVFNDERDPRGIEQFISDNFDLSKKTGGYQVRSY